MHHESLQRFADWLAELTKIPVHHLKTGRSAAPPYICWYVQNDQNFYADNRIYFLCGWSVVIEVYSRTDNEGLQILQALKEAGYSASLRDDNWIDDENLWLTILEVTIDAEND